MPISFLLAIAGGDRAGFKASLTASTPRDKVAKAALGFARPLNFLKAPFAKQSGLADIQLMSRFFMTTLLLLNPCTRFQLQ